MNNKHAANTEETFRNLMQMAARTLLMYMFIQDVDSDVLLTTLKQLL